METSATTGEIAKALAEFQKVVPAIEKGRTAHVPTKTGGSYSYKYADISDVLDAVRQPLSAQGIALTQTMAPHGEGLLLVTNLLHVSGESISSMLPIPDTGGNPQALGSWLTYARRYATCAILGIAAEEDDDGAGAKDAAGKKTDAGAVRTVTEHKCPSCGASVEDARAKATAENKWPKWRCSSKTCQGGKGGKPWASWDDNPFQAKQAPQQSPSASPAVHAGNGTDADAMAALIMAAGEQGINAVQLGQFCTVTMGRRIEDVKEGALVALRKKLTAGEVKQWISAQTDGVPF